MDRLEELGIDEERDGCWIWDIVNGVEVYSTKFCETFGYTKEEMGTSPEEWRRIIHPDDLPKAMDKYNDHVRSRGEIPYWIDVRYLHKQGNEVRIICEGDVVRWSDTWEPEILFGWHTII